MKYSIRFTIIIAILVSFFSTNSASPARAAAEWIVVNTNDNGPGSLRQAIANASDGDTVTFAASLAGQIIHLSSELEVDKSITIDGSNLNPRITLSGDTNNDGMGDVQIMAISFDRVIKISNIDFTNGKNEIHSRAGVINNFGGSVEVKNCTFSDNKGDFGGAILNKGSLIIHNCVFQNNSANEGGAIHNDELASVFIETAEFLNNTAVGPGGAIENRGHLIIEDATFNSNSSYIGGGIRNYYGEYTMTNIIFNNNSAKVGGGLANIFSNSTLLNVVFDGNWAYTDDGEGGGMFNANSSPKLTNVTFKNNTAYYGGALHNRNNSNPILVNVVFDSNKATLQGGGMQNAFNCNPVLENVTFSNNSAINGGGLRNFYNSNPTLVNVTFSNNSANYGGGMENNTNSSPSITSVTFSGNSASTSGGAMYNNSNSNPTLTNVILWDNIALLGDEILNNSSTPNISYSVVQGGCPAGSNCTQIIINDPMLAMLTNNGGFTQTMSLYSNSSAIDTGDNGSCAPEDQRGVVRPQGAGCDIGAYEYVEDEEDNTPPTVDTFTAPVSSNSLNIPVTAFTASDNVGVTGYLITTSSDAPASDAAGWTLMAPTTFTVAGNGTYSLHPWAKDAAGNVSALFETSPSVEVDTDLPTITSITRADDNPTAAASVDFTVTFSEPVTNVDAADFDLTTSGVSGAAITEVSGSGDEYIVTVDTGSGSGTIRLDVLASADITDLVENPLTGLPYEDGEVYDIQKRIVFRSIAAQDGWILESSETSNKGGTLNKGASTLNVGDDAANKQYRAVLSFNTTLPEGAVVTKATLKFKYAGKTGTLPFSTHGKLLVDVKTGAFSNNPALAKGDFNAGASKNALFSLGKSTGWFNKVFTSAQLSFINTSGVTQFRLRFAKDDNNDLGADFIKIYSGSAGSNAPQLIVEYYVP